jgi:hypothetical protein
MQNQHLAIKWRIFWNITTLKISQFYDGACEETPRKHGQVGESRAGCPNFFFILKKAPRLTFPEANGAELTRRNGTDSGRPFVRPSVRPSSSSSMRGHGGRKRQTARGRQTDGPRSSRVWPTNHARPQTPPIAPHGPGNYGPTTHQPAPHFPLHYVGPPSYPAPPGRPVPPPPGLVLLTGPKLPFPVTDQTTNKQTDWNVRLPHPSRTKLAAMASSSQRPLDTRARESEWVSEWVSECVREREREREHAHTHTLASTCTHLT